MTFQRGDVVLVPFPFSDLSTTKARPAVVVSGLLYNDKKPDLILAALTSNVAAATTSLDYVLMDWQMANLHYPSALKPALFTLEPMQVFHRIGALTPRDLKEVDQRLRLALEL